MNRSYILVWVLLVAGIHVSVTRAHEPTYPVRVLHDPSQGPRVFDGTPDTDLALPAPGTINLDHDGVGLNNDGTSSQPIQAAIDTAVGVFRVAFSFGTRSRNVSPDPDGPGGADPPPIQWGFPVRELGSRCHAPPATLGNGCLVNANCDSPAGAGNGVCGNVCIEPDASNNFLCTLNANCDSPPGAGNGVCAAGTPWVVANRGAAVRNAYCDNPPGAGNGTCGNAGACTAPAPMVGQPCPHPDGFSGHPEGYHHRHTVALQPTPASFLNYGAHVHIQLFIFKQQPIGGGQFGAVNMIGCSDLKHTFATKHDTGAGGEGSGDGSHDHHYAHFDENDTYNRNSNKDRDFLGPIAEMNPVTFVVANHTHFSDGGPAVVEGGFNVFDRGHGEKEHLGAAAQFDHRLITDIRDMLTVNQMVNGQNGFAPVGTKWFFASTYFVVGEVAKDRNNNTAFRQFDPGWNGTNFNPTWIGVTMRLDPNNDAMLIPIDQPGRFIGPHSYPGCAPITGPSPSPAVSDWGFVVIGLLILTGGTLIFQRCGPSLA